MSVEYEDNDKFKALAGILEDYTEWFGRVALLVAYHGEEPVPVDMEEPSSFVSWLEDNNSSSGVSSSLIQPLLEIDSSLKGSGKNIIEILKSDRKPSHSVFLEFKNLYSSFLSSIRRLEKDSALQVDGTDELTGIRPLHSVQRDIDKEMGRLERNGNPFALVVLRIDSFGKYEDNQNNLLVATENIKRSLRPFDDAYYLDQGRFLLSLKHSDIVGAEVVVVRIQNFLEDDPDNSSKITVTAILSEPVVGDGVQELLGRMKDDLNNNLNSRNLVLKLLDVSPLERFITAKN